MIRSIRCAQAIADTGFRQHELRAFRIDLKFLAELPHIDTQIFGVIGIRRPPHVRKNALMCEHTPVIGREIGKQFIFRTGKLDLLVATLHNVPDKINRKRPGFYQLALRFSRPGEQIFLANEALSAPPVARIAELQAVAYELTRKKQDDVDKIREWLKVLVAPGSSLGGARPKANLVDEDGSLWIAKFPSADDDYDVALWEMLLQEHHLRSDGRRAQFNKSLEQSPWGPSRTSTTVA